ncbi:MAG: hypothetical protein DCF22_21305 [Leptolyngbya sp.]|nr:MAG: hypothetical protein DCF22_21305 [Leptolyngbya sp.]
MTQQLPIDNLLNTLLSETVFGKDLSENDKTTVKEMVQALTREMNDELIQQPDADNSEFVTDDDAIAQLDAMLSELGVDPKVLSPDVTLDDLFDQQSDSTLIDALSDHVDSAYSLIEVLSSRPSTRQSLDELRRVELHLTAAEIGVADLQQILEGCRQSQPTQHSLRQRIKTVLLKEFNFINRLVRRV